MLIAALTTIQTPTDSVRALVRRLAEVGGRLVAVGDTKGPDHYDAGDTVPWPVDFVSLPEQQQTAFSLARRLPTRHYARKNLAYLHAIHAGATCVYETDDDNSPTTGWNPRSEFVEDARVVPEAAARWVNVYRYFSDEIIWPRGLPLDRIHDPLPETRPGKISRAPIQQGLVDGAPDVDAIWRLVMDRQFRFQGRDSIRLEPGNWCPFNTQSTWWWPVAYPLLYVPSHCSFRMCDIWKSFVAQRCLWAMGLGVVFHPPEVWQERNEHNLMHDFRDEMAGYDLNSRIGGILEALELDSGVDAVASNLRRCYVALVEEQVLPAAELELVDLWLKDVAAAGAIVESAG